MPRISTEEFNKRYGPIGTTLSFGVHMDLRSAWIFGHDMTKPFEERFHVITEADYDPLPRKRVRVKRPRKRPSDNPLFQIVGNINKGRIENATIQNDSRKRERVQQEVSVQYDNYLRRETERRVKAAIDARNRACQATR